MLLVAARCRLRHRPAARARRAGRRAARRTVPQTNRRSSRCASCWASIGAHEWRSKGIDVPAAGGRIHPHYGVFAPMRREYVDLVAEAPLPAATAATSVAFDIGTGTGVLAAVLARRGLARVIATDRDPRALACARANIEQLGLRDTVEVVDADLFPAGRAALVAVQSAVGARAAQLAARIRDLRSGEPDAARVSRGTRRAPRTGGRRLAHPVGSRRASRPAHARRADGSDRHRGVARRGSHGRATHASEGLGSDATPARGARGRSDVAVATRRALRGPRRRSRVG